MLFFGTSCTSRNQPGPSLYEIFPLQVALHHSGLPGGNANLRNTALTILNLLHMCVLCSGCNFCWYYEGYSGFSWLVLLFLGICDLPTLVRMAHALSRTGLKKNVFKWTILLFTSVYSVLLIDSFTSVDNIDCNITFTSPSAFVPTLMTMVSL